jgi:cobalt-zinc-cadmium resistance protein CzcA
MGEVFQYLVEAEGAARDTLTLLRLTNVQEYVIAPLLRTVPGVAAVNAWGGLEQRFEVVADPAKLAGFDLTLHDLETALANNANFGGGYIEDRGERLTLRGLGRVGRHNGHRHRRREDPRDATPVYDTRRRPRHDRRRAALRRGDARRTGREALSAAVIILKGLQRPRRREPRTPATRGDQACASAGCHGAPFYSQGEVVERTTHTVFRNLVEGALLVTPCCSSFSARSARRCSRRRSSRLPFVAFLNARTERLGEPHELSARSTSVSSSTHPS